LAAFATFIVLALYGIEETLSGRQADSLEQATHSHADLAKQAL
jgi:hypothetical protein